MAVYVQFNRFIDLTRNSYANPYHLASMSWLLWGLGALYVPGQLHNDFTLPQIPESFSFFLWFLFLGGGGGAK